MTPNEVDHNETFSFASGALSLLFGVPEKNKDVKMSIKSVDNKFRIRILNMLVVLWLLHVHVMYNL